MTLTLFLTLCQQRFVCCAINLCTTSTTSLNLGLASSSRPYTVLYKSSYLAEYKCCFISGTETEVHVNYCCSEYTIPGHNVTACKLAGNTRGLSRAHAGTSDVGYLSLYLDRSDMDQLTVRRRTYLLWPGWAPQSVDPDQLAEAGLFYSGEADEVRCYSCRQTFAGWNDGDVPLDVHRRRCPTCPVIVALDRRKPTGRAETSSVKLPADVEVDCDCRSTSKSTVDDCVTVDTRQMNTSVRKPTVPTTNLSKPGKLR